MKNSVIINKLQLIIRFLYCNVPKFSNIQIWANSADPDQTAPQGLHCLQFRLHLLGALVFGKAILFKF